MPAPEIIKQLVARFTDQREDYRSGRYNETQLRRDFLDPFFDALGWDVSNRKNYSEKFREVVHEVSVEVDGAAKAADYAFQTGGHVHFFIEAKKPAVNIESNPEPAFQIRRYGWSAKLNVSLLSDFEQLAVYDCRQKPVHGDPAHVGRANLYSFTEYIDKWDEIAGLLSYEAVHQGSLDKFTDSLKGKRGTADVDDAFLAEMEHWREELARVIALRNNLSQRQINTAVQLIIDRIIFLRICEDRGIEPENGLREATDGIDVYGDLMELFKKADKKYNSGLFHFEVEKGQSSHPDTLTPTLKIDDKVFKDILANLYLPKSPYAFNYFSAEILGQVYERFLGKVIRLTAGGHAKVEEKPEVRKAGGVYYTPAYIVEYIVKNTVGELLKDKTPADLHADPIRIVDPACGSGSFLLGAYQFLLDWTLNWYIANDPAKWAKGKNPPIYEGDKAWQLTMEKKKELLTSHIFGVDIDAQAVEVTKLSLLLKVVENPGQLDLFGERILPDLGENIKCGNSLIGPDYYDNQQLTMFDSEEQYRVNAFDWKSEFKIIFQKGGFDAVIGNPPYRKERDSKDLLIDLLKSDYGKKYYQGKMDFWYFFFHLAIDLAKDHGYISFITPSYWLSSSGASRLIERLQVNIQFVKMITFGENKIFENVSGKHMVFVSKKDNKNQDLIIQEFMEKNLQPSEISTELIHPTPFSKNSIQTNESIYSSDKKINITIGNNYSIFDKIALICFPLQDDSLRFEVSQGIVEAPDIVSKSIAIRVNDISCLGQGVFVIPKTTLDEFTLTDNEKPFVKKYLRGIDVKRFSVKFADYYVFYIGSLENRSISSNRKKYPNIVKHLDKYKKYITSSNAPYGIHRTRESRFFTVPKIIGQNMFDKPSFTYCEDELYVNFAFNVIINHSNDYSLKYLLGILNSSFSAFWCNLHAKKRGVNNDLGVGVLRTFPVRKISFSDPADVARHDRMVAMVESMLNLHKQSAAARLPDEKDRLARQIEQTDRQIDKLVYELYDLTPDEIKIVEGG